MQDIFMGQFQDVHKEVDDKLEARVPAHAPANGLTRQQMPSKPIVFHGRDDLVQEIAQLLCDEKTSRVCVLGPGGMGKTSVALAVVDSPNIRAKYPRSRCFWVPCVEAQSPTLFLQLLYSSLRISRATENTLGDIVSELNKSTEPRLILLDNFETPWVPVDGTQKEVSDALRQLIQINHVAILMTMRDNNPPCADMWWQTRYLGAIDRESARNIFHDIYTNSRQTSDIESVYKLLDALGCMPFAVMLMAKLGKKSESSAKDLLAEWSESGIEIISHSNSPEDNIYRSISLSVDRNFVQQNPNAVLLLQTLSLLPAGTSKENLRWWAPHLKSISSAIATLSDAAVLKPSTTLFVLPVVQSFMSSTKRIPESIRLSVHEACCRYVLNHGRRYYDPGFPQHAEALAAEDTNIQSILPYLETSPFPNVMEVLLRFTWYRFDTLPSTKVARRTLSLARKLRNDRYIAEALCALGGTYLRLDEHHTGEQYLSQALQLFDKLPDDPEISRLNAECISHLANARFYCSVSLMPTLSLLRTLQDKFPDGFERAHILKTFGFCFFWERQYLEALGPLTEAKDIFIQMQNPTDAALSLLWMARGHHRLSQLPKALDSIKGASEMIRGGNHPRFEVIIDCCHGSILISLDCHAKALSIFNRALSCAQSLGYVMMTGLIQENIGYIYMSGNDYQGASMAYQTAIRIYEALRHSPLAQSWELRCRKNLDGIKAKEENPDAKIILCRYRI
jgi:tetratricopeptide (TPR) repeat protein